VIGNGEMIIVETSSGEQRFKTGDGEKTFTQLPYTDETLLSKIKTYSAGDGITISNEGIISSISGDNDDVFVIEMTTSTTFSKTFDEIKAAIQAKKSLIGVPTNGTIPLYGYYFISGDYEYISLENAISGSAMYWLAQKATDSTDEPTWQYETIKIPNASSSESNSGTAYWNAINKKWEIKDIASGSDVYMLNMVSNANTIKITNDFDEAVAAADSGKILRVKDTNETNEVIYYNVVQFSSETNSSTNKTTADLYIEADLGTIIYNFIWDKDTQEASISNATSENDFGDSYLCPFIPANDFNTILNMSHNGVHRYPHILNNGQTSVIDIQILPLDTTKENSVTGNIYFTKDIGF
jgi:hypothetical protein